MLFKLSIKNIRKSIKDYSIYFFTLVFAVAMFYMFNSIDAQSSMLELNNSKEELIRSLVYIMGYVSVFVSIILGFLIVYSNNFLIRKRKKEIGLYFTLGMSKAKVSMILVIETIIIGIFSLAVGLLFGLFLSQFISVFTAKLFEVNMSDFKFVFSMSAFTKTLLYFGLIYIFVMIFNIITLSRYKLIDLLNASKKSERVRFRNKYTIIISFILSLICLGYAYKLLFNHALLMMGKDTNTMILLGAIGTFLLFFSMSGFLVKVIECIKRVYYKDLNMFTLKQINSKINTTVISTTIISLMLLLTIGILSGSMSLASVFNNDLKENNPTDYTIKTYANANDIEKGNLDKYYDTLYNVVNDDAFKKYSNEFVVYNKYYDENIRLSNVISKASLKKIKNNYGDALSLDYNLPIISETDYKKIMKLYGKKFIDIKEDEYLILANFNVLLQYYNDYYEKDNTINIAGFNLKPGSSHIIETTLENSASASNDGVIVVSDNIVKYLDRFGTTLIGNYIKTDDIESLEKSFSEFVFSDKFNFELGLAMYLKSEIEMSSVGLKAILIFIGLYLGITFAITSATVLAIGQLSEASDNKNRYNILRQIGADNKLINKSLFIQIAVSFMFPLIVALIHSYFGLKEVNRLIYAVGHMNLLSNITLTALFIVIVYGGYFLFTYICSKNLLKEN